MSKKNRRHRAKKSRARGVEDYLYIFLIIVMVFCFSQTYYLFMDIRAIGWPTTTGHVKQKRTYQRSGPVRVTGNNLSPAIVPVIENEYTYSYDLGTGSGIYRYRSERESYGFTFVKNFEFLDESDTMDFYVARDVKVYYYPDDPRKAVLIPGPKFINALLVVLSWEALLFIWKKIRERRNNS